jgi:nucleotide-binding universal stress UspA family protein
MDTQRILVAVDFTESSDLAMVEARRLAGKLGAGIALAHVVALPPASPRDMIGRAEADLHSVEAAREQLEALIAECAREGIAAEKHLCVGSVVMGLMDLIEQLKPTMVVVGSHGKGRLTRALVGSVAESLLRRSPVPVLVVPSPKRRMAAQNAAWMCRDCGHILGHEGTHRCHECGANPAHWVSAPIANTPIDAGEAAIGETDRESVSEGQRNSPSGLFATSVGGARGDVSINPELRVRY